MMKMTKAQREEFQGMADRLTVSSVQECYIAKRSYFYHHGVYTEQFEKAVVATCARVGLVATVVESHDRFHGWPKDSWLEVRFTVAPAHVAAPADMTPHSTDFAGTDTCEACGKNVANHETEHGILCDACNAQVAS